MEYPNQTLELANKFSVLLRGYLTAEQFNEAIALNKTPEYPEGICASHNYLDANEVMAEAFKFCTGYDVDVQNQSHVSLWGSAWDAAKANDFQVYITTNPLITYVRTNDKYDTTVVREILNCMFRVQVIDFLVWNDSNGIYSDSQCERECIDLLTESAAKLLAMELIINA